MLSSISNLYNPRPSAGEFTDLTTAQNVSITVTQIVIFVLGGIVLLLWAFNCWGYVYKQRQNECPCCLLFYLNAVIIVIELMIDTRNVPNTDFCAYRLIIGVYGTQALYLNLGICQAGILTTLFIKLNSLFNLKD